MIQTDSITRVLFEDFRPSAIRLFYVIGFAAIAVFCWGVYVQVRKYRRGVAAGAGGSLLTRFGDMVGAVLSHRTVARRDPQAGAAHRLIFYGFVLLFIGTATITLDYDILGPLFGVHFWHGEFYLWFSLVLDIAGVMLVGGLIYMMYRRGWLRLPKLDYARPDRQPTDPDYDRSGYRREDWAFLWTLILIAFTGYVLEAVRLVWLADRPDVWGVRWWSPAGAAMAEAMRAGGMSSAAGGIYSAAHVDRSRLRACRRADVGPGLHRAVAVAGISGRAAGRGSVSEIGRASCRERVCAIV